MAAGLGDLIQITDFQTYLGQAVLNVYYYRIVAALGITDAGYTAMLEWFEENVVTPVSEIQSEFLLHDTLELRNLSNGLDIATLITGVNGTGTSADSALPSYVTVSYKLVRESLATRNGAKRFGGIVEEHVEGNTWELAGSSFDLAIAEALAMDYEAGLALVAEPIIVKRPIDVPVGTTYTYSSIGSAIFTRLGTQNTRKAGRGI